MRKQKLTLSLEPEMIDLAKKLAKEHHISVSKMFRKFIKWMATPGRPVAVTPNVLMAIGIVELPEGDNRTSCELIEWAKEERWKDYLKLK